MHEVARARDDMQRQVRDPGELELRLERRDVVERTCDEHGG